MGLKRLPVFLEPYAIFPNRAHDIDAGLDLFTPEEVTVPAFGRVSVDTGVHVGIPAGYVGNLESKSGLMLRKGITCAGTIDAGYTGSICAILFNHTDTPVHFDAGDKITQLVIRMVETPHIQIVDSVNDLGKHERGTDGFGSTGK